MSPKAVNVLKGIGGGIVILAFWGSGILLYIVPVLGLAWLLFRLVDRWGNAGGVLFLIILLGILYWLFS